MRNLLADEFHPSKRFSRRNFAVRIDGAYLIIILRLKQGWK